VTCSQALGHLRQGAEPHVGQTPITSDRPPHGDACDTGRDDHIDGSEWVTGSYIVKEAPERLDGSSTRM
jgi:hypothetical protein